jgi:hypothetical protein
MRGKGIQVAMPALSRSLDSIPSPRCARLAGNDKKNGARPYLAFIAKASIAGLNSDLASPA